MKQIIPLNEQIRSRMTLGLRRLTSRCFVFHVSMVAGFCYLGVIVGCEDGPSYGTSAVDELPVDINRSDNGQVEGEATKDSQEKEFEKLQIYDGLSLIEWRERIKNLDPASPNAKASVAGLVAIVEDQEAPWFSRRQAALTLGRIGKPAESAVPVLIDLLDETGEGESSARLWAIQGLALFGPVAEVATNQLIEILKDETNRFAERVAPLDALSRIGIANSGAIPGLIWALNYRKSSNSKLTDVEVIELRALAAEAMTVLGSDAQSAVPYLIRAARDDSELIRRNAIATLGTIGAAAEIAIPALVEVIILDESPVVRDNAAEALAKIGPASVPELESLLTDEEQEVRWRAVASLGKIGPAAKKSVPAIKNILSDEDSQVRIEALEALWKISADPSIVLTPVLNELANKDRQIRIHAVRLLVDIAAREESVIDRLQELREDDRPQVRQAVRQALQKIDAE